MNGQQQADLAVNGGSGTTAAAGTPYDSQFQSLSQRINEDFDELYRREAEIDDAFKIISDIYNTCTIQQIYEDRAIELQDAFDKISASLSFIYELLGDIVQKFQKVEYPRDVTVPNIASPQQAVVNPKPTGILGKIQSFLGMFQDAQKKELEKSLAMFSGLIQQIGMNPERWDTFTLQHEEFSRIYERYAKGKDPKMQELVMRGYLNTERRNIRKARNIVKPVTDGGQRVNRSGRQKDLIGMATAISAASASKSADAAMFQNIGAGMGRTIGARTGSNGMTNGS